MTAKQIAALKYLIFISQDGGNLSKRILVFLIEKSNRLTEEVCIVLQEGEVDYTSKEIREASSGVHDMQSSNRHTHIDQILHAMGSSLLFSSHAGDFKKTERGKPLKYLDPFCCYTFWLSKKPYSTLSTVKYVPVTRTDLEKIELKKPGLYPRLEAV